MLVDARTVPGDKTFEADLCIVGAGAAGITMARELTNKGLSVIVLESGGFEFDEEVQGLYRGDTLGPFMPSGEAYLTRSRLRYFGGSTNHWEGQCRPLDDIDFEERSWVPDSGWPFPKSHLETYYKRAASVCQIEPFDYDVALLHGPEQIADLPVPVAESPGAVRIGHPERSHLVEYLAPNSVFNSLPRQRSSPHLRPDDRLVTIDRVLHHASLGGA